MRTWVATVIVVLLAAAGVTRADAPGKASFDKLCQSCHAADGSGNAQKAKVLKIDPQLLNLGREEVSKLSRADLKKILLDGKGKMPAYQKKLAPADVDPLLDYALELAKALRGK
jgi:mono/diheme cytochrome c family protein